MQSMRKKGPSLELWIVLAVLSAAFIAELYRVKGFLLLDLLAPLLLAVWLLKKWLKKEPIHWPKTLLPAALFLCVGTLSLLFHATKLSSFDFLESAFYGVRWASLFGLSILTANSSAQDQNRIFKALCAFALLLLVAGFIQLQTVPDFSAYEALGWDPHQGRLLSTWFDPNFVGGFFAFLAPLVLGVAWDEKKSRPWSIGLPMLLVLGVALTLSRSSYVALGAGFFVFGLLRSIRLLGLGVVLVLLLGLAVPSVGSRFESLVNNIQSVSSETYTLPDASSRLRYDSWRIGWALFLDQPLFGQGYNNYKWAALEEGLIKDPDVHAASGSDSSVLTILATTGILGFLPFLSLYALLFLEAWKKRQTGLGLGFLGGLVGLGLHSIFVNSLLFPLFMAPFWISAGVLIGAPSSKEPLEHLER